MVVVWNVEKSIFGVLLNIILKDYNPRSLGLQSLYRASP